MQIEDVLTSYPGHGLIYLVDNNAASWWVYFITGRSESPRGRSVKARHGCLAVEPTDPTASPDDLRHYVCARHSAKGLVVGNGDHVDIIVDGLNAGGALDSILLAIDPEPDPPIWTPRIALVLSDDRPLLTAVSRSPAGEISREIRSASTLPSHATVLTTYSGTAAEPVGDAPLHEVREHRSIKAMCEGFFWDHLDESLRVLAVAGPANGPLNPGTVEWAFVLM